MKKSVRCGLVTLLVLSMLLVVTGTGFQLQAAENAASGGSYYYAGPPNEDAVAQLLIRQGKLSADASAAQIARAVLAYEQQKLAAAPKSATQVKQELLAAGASDISGTALNNLVYNEKYGGSGWGFGIQSAADHPADVTDQTKLLVLLVQFGGDETSPGPLHNQITQPTAANNSSFWVNDFSQDHYQNMLFNKGGYDAIDQNGNTLHLDSMTDYYLTQSNGTYEIDGYVFQWVTVAHSEAYYGDDSATGHDNILPGTPHDLVADAVAAADAAGLDFSQFDNENPYGLAGDDYYIPDGIIDHLVLVHAGVDQSGGGGAQGDNAIWAHSSTVDYGSVAADSKIIYNYVMQGEDCGIGTFAHEYGHDLGLPDEYDTLYSGTGEPVGYWSLMATGSWLGQPLDVKPSSISIWGRAALGWVTPKVVTGKSAAVLLDQSVNYGDNEQALRINLPMQILKYPASPQSGTGMWYSGQGDELTNYIQSAAISLTGTSVPLLTYKTWYDIEEGWDFCSVQISTDGGSTFKSLSAANMTSDYVPEAMNSIIDDLPGYTGSSNGWLNETIDLSAYASQSIILRFLYQTDWGTSLTGIFFDDMRIADGTTTIWSDNCESAGNWTAEGFMINNGTYQRSHYYIAEWRNFQKTDATLKNAYSFINVDDMAVDYYAFNPGLLVWYRNFAYSDNWVGYHPGYGFLGLVDAHAAPLINPSTRQSVNTRLALYDAAFGLKPLAAQKVNIYDTEILLKAKPGNPLFDDSQPYWFAKAPSAGLKLPRYGVKIAVTSQAKDMTVGKILVSNRSVK